MFTPICVAGHTLKHLREYYADSKKEKNVQDIKGNIIKNIFFMGSAQTDTQLAIFESFTAFLQWLVSP